MKQAKAIRKQQLTQQSIFTGYCQSGSQNFITIDSITPQGPIKVGSLVNVHFVGEFKKDITVPTARVVLKLGPIQLFDGTVDVGTTEKARKINEVQAIDLRQLPLPIPPATYTLTVYLNNAAKQPFFCGNFKVTVAK